MHNNGIKYAALMLITAIFLFSSCEKDVKNEKEITGEVCFYLLKSYKTRENSSEIIKSTVRIADNAIIEYKDIISYNTNLNVYTISKRARDTIVSLISPVSGPPFAVAIDKEVIYAGYFWPVTSPVTCEWVYIDPLFIDFWDGLKVMPGNNWDKPNPANDNDLIKIFQRDKKLTD